MIVKEFMIPASKVITVNSADPLEKALSRMVEKNVGCVVVLDSAKSKTSPDSAQAHPVGIVSKVREAMGRRRFGGGARIQRDMHQWFDV